MGKQSMKGDGGGRFDSGHEVVGDGAENLDLVEDRIMGDSLGRLSLIGYLLGASLAVWSFVPQFHAHWAAIHVTAVFLLGQVVDGKHYNVWWRASLLGCVLSLGILLSSNLIGRGRLFSLGWYVIFLSLFHFLEYLVTALTNPSNLSTDSFLLNHSKAYGVASLASFAEFFLEFYFFPGLKQHLLVSSAGAVICCLGDTLRKLAMFHAGNNFNHVVQCYRSRGHYLVTSGVFAWMRHPSYVGWFYWSISTQLILCNPICCLVYALVSWNFFNERIYVEEYALLNFFGSDYLQYQKEVPTGLPLITGYTVTEKKS